MRALTSGIRSFAQSILFSDALLMCQYQRHTQRKDKYCNFSAFFANFIWCPKSSYLTQRLILKLPSILYTWQQSLEFRALQIQHFCLYPNYVFTWQMYWKVWCTERAIATRRVWFTEFRGNTWLGKIRFGLVGPFQLLPGFETSIPGQDSWQSGSRAAPGPSGGRFSPGPLAGQISHQG